MTNEVLAKVLCHNLCCLNQEAHELGFDFVPRNISQDWENPLKLLPFSVLK
jgi:hypothetical protein